jgi:hypothetical protein
MASVGMGSGTEAVLARHWRDFCAGDVEAIMADYAADAILVTPQATRHGQTDIRAGFERLFTEMFPPASSTCQLEKQVVEGELAFITWTGESPIYKFSFATDTFVIRNGKIQMQTFAAVMEKK